MPLKAQPRLLERGLFTGTIDYPPPMIDIEQANRAAREILRSIKKLPGFASHAARIYQKLGSRRKQSRLKRTTTHV
jgi:hypothetical protein